MIDKEFEIVIEQEKPKITLDSVKGAKFVSIGSGMEIEDDALIYLYENKIEIPKEYNERLRELLELQSFKNKRAEVLKKLGITEDELSYIL